MVKRESSLHAGTEQVGLLERFFVAILVGLLAGGLVGFDSGILSRVFCKWSRVSVASEVCGDILGDGRGFYGHDLLL